MNTGGNQMTVNREKATAVVAELQELARQCERLSERVGAVMDGLLTRTETSLPEPDPQRERVRAVIGSWHQRHYSVLGNSAAWDDLFNIIMGLLSATDEARLREARVEGAKMMQSAAREVWNTGKDGGDVVSDMLALNPAGVVG